jgi:regulator of ribonuclease activity A
MADFLTADLSDAHPDAQVLELLLQSFGGHSRFAGPIETIKAWEDNSRVREALGEPGDGRVLVVDGGGSIRRAMLGDQLAAQGVANGWAGVLIHGCLRDSEEIGTMAIGVKALGTCPRKTDKLGAGERGIPVSFGGVTFRPGSWLYSDPDGVLVAPRPLAKP